MATIALPAPTHSAEALLNRARRLSSASYEKSHPQPPSPTRFADGEEPERSSPGIMANSNGSHPFLLSSRPLSGSRRSSFGRTGTYVPSFYTHANRSESSAHSERFLDPHRARTPDCTTTPSASLALSLSSNASSTVSTPTPSSPSLSPTTTSSFASSSSQETSSGAEATAPVAARRSWTVSARPRALTLESIKETDLLTVESADNTLALLQAARKDVHRKHRSENGQGMVFVGDVLSVLRQGSDVDLTQPASRSINLTDIKQDQEEIMRGTDNDSPTTTESCTNKNNSSSSSNKGEATKMDDAGSSSSSFVSLTVTLSPCFDADTDDANNNGTRTAGTEDALNTTHIDSNKTSCNEEGGSVGAQPKIEQEAWSNTVFQALDKADAEQKRGMSPLDDTKQLPARPSTQDTDNSTGSAADATISTTSTIDATIFSSSTATASRAEAHNNNTQGLLVPDEASLSPILPPTGEDDEHDDVMTPLTAPASPSAQSLKSSGSTGGKSGKLSKKRSSKLFGKLVPKFLQTSFTPNNPPTSLGAGTGMAAGAMTPSPRSQTSSHPSPLSATSSTTPSSIQNPDQTDNNNYSSSSKMTLLPPLPTISPSIEKDLSSVFQQHDTKADGEDSSFMKDGSSVKSGRRTSQSSAYSHSLSSATVPTITTAATENNNTIAVTFDEEMEEAAASSAEDDKEVPEKKEGNNDDSEFWSSILLKSGATVEDTTITTTSTLPPAVTVTSSSVAPRLNSHPSSVSLSSVNSFSSPVCYAESLISYSPHVFEKQQQDGEATDEMDDDKWRVSTPPLSTTNSETADSSAAGGLGRDEHRMRLRNAVAEWRRAASSS